MEARTGRLIDIRQRTPESIWPTSAQLNLLRAALWSGDEARAAWTDWQDTTDLRTIDFSSWNLLPLVWRNLTGQGMTDPVLAECRGYYRYHWARNQVLLNQAGEWVAAWQERGIPVLVLKGAALVVDVYGDTGLRPMSDIDLLVPLEKVQEVAAWLQRDGWVKHVHLLDWENVTLEAQQSYNWQKGQARLDLHWHVDERCTDPEVTLEYWAQAQPFRLNGVPTRRLCPEHMLLHVCSHGMIWNPGQAPFRWLVDAEFILRRYGHAFNWARLIDQADRSRSSLVLRHGLEYAAANLRLPVPAGVLDLLRSRRSTWRERSDFQRTTSPDHGGRWGRTWNFLCLLWRAGGRGSPIVRARRMSRFLCTRWGGMTLGQAVWFALHKTITGHRETRLAASESSPKR